MDLFPLYQGQYFLGLLYSKPTAHYKDVQLTGDLQGRVPGRVSCFPLNSTKVCSPSPRRAEDFHHLLSRRKTRKAFPLEPIATAPYTVTEITPSIQDFGSWIPCAPTAIQSFAWSRQVIIFSAGAKLLISDCSSTPLVYAAENLVRWFFGIMSIFPASQYSVNWQLWIWDHPTNGLI